MKPETANESFFNIYILHAETDSTWANTLYKHLKTIKKVNVLNTKQGAGLGEEHFTTFKNNVTIAHLIIIIVSIDCINDCEQELLYISKLYNNNEVNILPIFYKSCGVEDWITDAIEMQGFSLHPAHFPELQADVILDGITAHVNGIFKKQTYTKVSTAPIAPVANENVSSAPSLVSKNQYTNFIANFSISETLISNNYFDKLLSEAAERINKQVLYYIPLRQVLNKPPETPIFHEFIKRITSTQTLLPAEIIAVSSIINARSLEWYDKALIVNALTVSVMQKFDAERLHLLLSFAFLFHPKITPKALIGVLMAITSQYKKVSLYPNLLARLQQLKKIPTCQRIFFQAIRVLQNKENIYFDIISKENLEKTTVFDTFFTENTHYLMPFFANNSLLQAIIQNTQHNIGRKFSELITHTTGINAANKYAFCLTLNSISQNELTTVIQQITNYEQRLKYSNTAYLGQQIEIAEHFAHLHLFLCKLKNESIQNFTIEHIKPLVKLVLHNTVAQKITAFQYLQNKEYDKAIVKFKQLLKIFPNNYLLWYNLGVSYQEQNNQSNLPKALYCYKKAYALGLKTVLVLDGIGYAYQNISEPDFKKALQYHLKSYQQYNGNFWNLKNLAFCYQKITPYNFEKALEIHLQAQKINNSDAWNSANIAFCYQKIEKPNYELSVQYALHAYSLDKTYAWNVGNLAYAYQVLPTPNYAEAIKYYEAALLVNYPNITWLYNNLSVCYQNIKNYDKAITCAQEALNIDPQNINAFLNLAFCYRSHTTPQYQKAIEMYNTIQPPTFYANMGLAFCYLDLKKYDDALKYALAAEAIQSTEPQAIKLIGFVYENLNNNTKALQYYIKAFDLQPNNEWTVKQIGAFLYKNGEHNTALKYLLANGNAAPKNYDIDMLIADCYIALNQYHKAKEQYTYMISKYKHTEYLLGMYGWLHQKITPAAYNTALEYHLQAYNLNPKYEWNTANIAYCYQKISEPNFELCVQYALITYELNSNNTWNIHNLAFAYHNLPLPDYNKAIKYYLLLTPNNYTDIYTIYSNLVYCYINIEEYKKALKYNNLVIKKYSNNISAVLNNIIIYYNLQPTNYAKMLEYLNIASHAAPQNYIVLQYFAYYYLYSPQKNYKLAYDYILQAHKLNPTHEAIYFSVAFCAFLNADFNTAKQYFEKILTDNSIYAINCCSGLGHIALVQKNKKEAVQYYAKGMNLHANATQFIEELSEDFKYLEPFNVTLKNFNSLLNEVKKQIPVV